MWNKAIPMPGDAPAQWGHLAHQAVLQRPPIQDDRTGAEMKPSHVDYSFVPSSHDAIHGRMCQWAMWVRVRVNGWHTHPMWRNAKTSRQWDVDPHVNATIDTLDALLIERTVSRLPDKHRDAIRWYYVKRGDPARMAAQLGVSKQGLADLVMTARIMVMNLTH